MLDVIAAHYSEIKKLVTWEDFKAKLPAPPDWYLTESNIEGGKSVSNVPEELQKLKVVEKEGDVSYFIKGVDSTGQPYSIYYQNDKLVLDFNSSVEETFDPVLQDYKDMKKKLDKYLKQLDKEA